MKRNLVLGGVVLVTLFVACTRGSQPSGSRPTPAERSVIVYSSADKEFAELIFKAYETKTGVKVLPVYDTEETKTAGLTARLLAEAAHPRADVFWSSDTSRALALAERGLAAAPDVLLLDEPFSSVDPATRRSLRALLREISPRVAGPTIYVTHDPGDAHELAERVVRLHDGSLETLAGTAELDV